MDSLSERVKWPIESPCCKMRPVIWFPTHKFKCLEHGTEFSLADVEKLKLATG